MSFAPDLAALPGGLTIAPGETWNSQYWTRDGASSNLSNGLSIPFSTDNEAAVQFPVTRSSQAEDPATLEVEITLSEPSHTELRVPYATSGTATYGVDWWVDEPNPIVVGPGDVSFSITINVAEDVELQGDETAVVTLGTPSGGVLGTAPVFTLDIVGDD
ncbi:MAG: hypothetical protein GY711_06275 [bacterium]|nr:hypothetical protein [bacterium]